MKNTRDVTVKKVLAFLDSYQISYSFIAGKILSREDLKKMLSLAKFGFEEIFVSVDKARRVHSKLYFRESGLASYTHCF